MRDEMREWFYLGLNMKQLEAGSVKDKIRKWLGVKYIKKKRGQQKSAEWTPTRLFQNCPTRKNATIWEFVKKSFPEIIWMSGNTRSENRGETEPNQNCLQSVPPRPELHDVKIIPTISIFIISSVRSSSVYHGLIWIQRSSKPLWSFFSNYLDSKVLKRPNMCYIFEKTWYSRISNMTSPCIKC